MSSTLSQSAYIPGTSSADTYPALAGGGTRESTATYTFNAYGQGVTESDVPDTGNSAEDSCTTVTYAVNTNKSVWLVDLPSEVNVVALPCSIHANQPSQVISDTAYSYDGGGTPTAGNLTQLKQAVSASLSFGILVYTYTTELTRTYDQYGRVLTPTDADRRKTTPAHIPATAAEPAAVQATHPASLVTTASH